MQTLLRHFTGITGVSYFVAPTANVRPALIAENAEYIEIVTKGRVFWDVDGRTREFGRGTIFWHCGGGHTIHRTPPDDLYQCFCCRFVVMPGEKPLCPPVGFWNSPLDLDIFVRDCQNLYHGKMLPDDALSAYIIGVLLRQMTASGGARLPAALETACELINRDLRRDYAVEELAEYCGISRPHLFRLFKSCFNLPPHRYVLRQRLTRARTLLASSPAPIKAIAAECGFANIEVFYRQFKHADGISPGEYRKRNAVDEAVTG